VTAHLHLVPRLIMRGAIPPFPIRLHDMVLNKVQGQVCILLIRNSRSSEMKCV
jgi:hypothetical protein